MEQMRSEFEAWFTQLVKHPVIFPAYGDGEYTEGEEYSFEFYRMLQAMWMAWQASRDAIEIKAPETESYLGTRQVTFERDAMWTDAISATGLRVKEKL